MRYKEKNIQHESDFDQINKLIISAYSEDPDRTVDHVINFLNGLCSYPKEWYCDHNVNENQLELDLAIKEIPGGPNKTPHKVYKNTIVHNGFASNIIYGPVAIFYDNEENEYKSSNGTDKNYNKISDYAIVIFNNGHCILKFSKNSILTKIILEISSFDNIDIDLVADHLRAPSIKGDGFGAFDISYSYLKQPIVNTPLNLLLENRNINNTIDTTIIACLYCDDHATKWDLSASKSITVCDRHFENKNLPYKSIKYYGNNDSA